LSEERVRFTGRDLTEALAAARARFGLPRHEIAFEVIAKPKPGLMGAEAGLFEIDAWPNPGAPPPPAPVERGGRGDRERGGRGGRGGRDRGDRGDRGSRDRGDRGPHGRDRDREWDSDRRPAGPRADDGEPVELLPLLPGPELTDIAPLLDHLARALVTGMGLDLTVEGIDQDEIGLRVRLVGEDVPLLLESDGEGLEALQYLANRVLQKDGRVPGRVSFDAGGWRARSEARLVDGAQQIAREVLATGQPRKLTAMGPYERRLIHVTLSHMPGIKTFSTGSGYHRRLHIAPAGSETGDFGDHGTDGAADED
jgi:spoIIIJ-associated protein